VAYTYEELLEWHAERKLYPMAQPAAGHTQVDYHRMQVERWLWDQRERMQPPAVDIGAEWDRHFVGYGHRKIWSPYTDEETRYRTLNNTEYDTAYAEVKPSILGSITNMPFRDGEVGTVLCTSVLEHVANLFRAVAEIKRVLEPGGWAFISIPFIWPTHDTVDYGDFWRVTEQGLRFLFNDFATVEVTPIEMRRYGKLNFTGVVNWEVMGDGWINSAPTGYCMAAQKPEVEGWKPLPPYRPVEEESNEDTPDLG
jgi:hypothetical protein